MIFNQYFRNLMSYSQTLGALLPYIIIALD